MLLNKDYINQAPTTSKSLTLSDEMLKPKISSDNKPEWVR